MINNQIYATPPVQIPIKSQVTGNMHDSWLNYFESVTRQLNNTLTPQGNVMPSLTQEEATNVATNSTQKVIYNGTTSSYQGNINGAWETFTTVSSVSNSQLSSFVGTHPDRVQFVFDTDNNDLYVVKGNDKFKLVKE